MCLGNLVNKKINTPFGTISGQDVKDFLKTFEKIIKAVIARTLYALYTVLVVWRVTEALRDDSYWSLLFCISLIGVETLHTIIWRKGGELKWVTPSVFFYLVCAVPSIWLLEIKLLGDRQQGTVTEESQSITSVIELNLSDEGWTLAMEQILIFVLVFGKWIAPKGELTRDQLSQLLLVQLGTGADIMELLESFNEEQVSVNSEIVYLVMSIWSWSLLQFCIVPTTFKEIPEVDQPINPEEMNSNRPCSSKTKEDKLSKEKKNQNTKNPDAVNGKMMANGKKEPNIPSTSTQPEAVKQTKTVKEKKEIDVRNGTNAKTTQSANSSIKQKGGRSNKVGSLVDESENKKVNKKCPSKPDGLSNKEFPSKKGGETGTKTSANQEVRQNGIVENNMHTPQKTKEGVNKKMVNGDHSHQKSSSISPWDHSIIVIHDEEDDLKLKDKVEGYISGRSCCTSFCFYNEIWGMVLSLVFQDGPFLITRLFIMFYYKVVSHMTVFFTFKNIVTIVLMLNRIRVVVLEEHKQWKEHMNKVNAVRKRNEEIEREKKRKDLKSKTKHDPSKNGLSDHKKPSNNSEHSQDKSDDQNSKSPRKKLFKKPRWLFWRI